MDQPTLITLIVVGGLFLLVCLGLAMYTISSAKTAAKRVYAPYAWGSQQGPQPQQSAGHWNQYKQACPPSATPGCVPARLVEQADEYVAIRVRASGCGCDSGQIGTRLQRFADMAYAQQDARDDASFHADLVDMVGAKKVKGSS